MSTNPNPVEAAFERGLFLSRWLLAPLYAGLALALLALAYVFLREFLHLFAQLPTAKANDVILALLALVDLTLVGNLAIIVIFSGYENFVSRFSFEPSEDRPEWQGKVDFSAIKIKLIGSMVAISGIQLLKVFMEIAKHDPAEIRWMVVLHLVFVVSGLLMAAMDWITAHAKSEKKGH